MMYREGFQMGKISKCEGKTIKLIENNTEEYLSILIVENTTLQNHEVGNCWTWLHHTKDFYSMSDTIGTNI